MADERPITVNVPFSIDNGDGSNYSDAIVFTKEEFDALTAADVKAIRAGTHKVAKARHVAWRKTIRDAAKAPAESDLERRKRLRLERADLLERQARVERELVDVEPEVPADPKA